MKRRSLFVLLTVMALIAAACSGGDDGSTDASDSGGSGEPVQITLWHGYGEPGVRNGVENYEADSMQQLIDEFNQTHPDIEVDNVFCCSNDNALQKVTVALQGGQQPDITYQYGTSLPQLSRHAGHHGPHRPRGRGRLRLGRLLPGRAGGLDRGRSRAGHPGADRQPRDRLQQATVRRRQPRPAHGGLDVGRLPHGRQGAHRPGDEAVRVRVPRRRQRGHRLALRRDAVGGGRRHPQRRQHRGGVQLRGRPHGA